jgi:hypothetical protein
MHASYASQTLLKLHLQKLEWNKRVVSEFQCTRSIPPFSSGSGHLGTSFTKRSMAHGSARCTKDWTLAPLCPCLEPLSDGDPMAIMFIHFHSFSVYKILQDHARSLALGLRHANNPPWPFPIIPQPLNYLNKRRTYTGYQIKFMFISPSAETSLAFSLSHAEPLCCIIEIGLWEDL